jgi:hypothetical protein
MKHMLVNRNSSLFQNNTVDASPYNDEQVTDAYGRRSMTKLPSVTFRQDSSSEIKREYYTFEPKSSMSGRMRSRNGSASSSSGSRNIVVKYHTRNKEVNLETTSVLIMNSTISNTTPAISNRTMTNFPS